MCISIWTGVLERVKQLKPLCMKEEEEEEGKSDGEIGESVMMS